jgi:Helix-turn-helix domain
VENIMEEVSTQRLVGTERLTMTATLVFNLLIDHARGKNWPWCWPSEELLAERVGRHVRTIRRAIAELVGHRLITVTRANRNASNRYRISVERASEAEPREGTSLSSREGTSLSSREGTSLSSREGTSLSSREGTSLSSRGKSTIIEKYLIEEDLKEGAPMPLKGVLQEMQTRSTEPTSAKEPFVGRKVLDWAQSLAVKFHAEQTPTCDCRKCIRADEYFVSLLRAGVTRNAIDAEIVRAGRVAAEHIFTLVDRLSDPKAQNVRVSEEKAREARNRASEASKQQQAMFRQYDEEAGLERKRQALVWENLPEEAKQEVLQHVLRKYPLYHQQGRDKAEVELACINELFGFSREAKALRRKYVETKK